MLTPADTVAALVTVERRAPVVGGEGSLRHIAPWRTQEGFLPQFTLQPSLTNSARGKATLSYHKPEGFIQTLQPLDTDTTV